MLNRPHHGGGLEAPARRRAGALSAPRVISLAARRARRQGPVLHWGQRHFRVVNPRLQPLGRWVARAGWLDWFYEPGP